MGILKRLGRDERGISAVVAVVSLLGIFGAATLSIDAGNAWQSRRNLITGTDAAALSEASELGMSGGSSCTGIYDSVLTNNSGSDVYERTCTVTPGAVPGTGYVTVEGRKPVDVRFGAVLGLGDTNAYSMSAAMVGFPVTGRGLRPIAFCDQNEHVQEWLDLRLRQEMGTDDEYDQLDDVPTFDDLGRLKHPPEGTYAEQTGVVHRMYFLRSVDDGACGTFSGNWGWLNFDGGNNATGEINDWLTNGYDGDVSIRDSSDPACPGVPGTGDATDSEQGCVPATPGDLGSSIKPGLDAIMNKTFHILVIDSGACVGGGTTCRLEAWGFLGVTLRGYKVTGPNSSRYFDFEFTNIQISGICCDSTPNGDTGTRVITLCAVDHDSASITAANRCGAVL